MKHHEYVPIFATTRNTAFHKNQPININQIYILKGVHSKSFGIELKKALCYISNISLIETLYSKLLIIFLKTNTCKNVEKLVVHTKLDIYVFICLI